jgi:hypothetical protein
MNLSEFDGFLMRIFGTGKRFISYVVYTHHNAFSNNGESKLPRKRRAVLS